MPVFGKLGDALDRVSDYGQLATKSIGGIRDAIDAAKTGDFTSALGNVSGVLNDLEPVAKAFGLDVIALPQPLQDVADKASGLVGNYSDLKSGISDVSTLFSDFEADAPGLEGTFASLGAAAGELAGPLAAIATATGGVVYGLQAIRDQMDNADFNAAGGMLSPDLLKNLGMTPQQFKDSVISGKGMPDAPPAESGGEALHDLLGGPDDNPPPAPASPAAPTPQTLLPDLTPRADATPPPLAPPPPPPAPSPPIPTPTAAAPASPYRVPSPAAVGSGMAGGDYGTSTGNPTIAPTDENSIREWVQRNFGIPNTFGGPSWNNAHHDYDGKLHHRGLGGATVSSGYAFDFHGSNEQMAALANWVSNNWAKDTLELIYGGPGFDRSREIKNGKYGDVYGSDLNAQHQDHVHWAMTAAPDTAASGQNGSGTGPTGAAHDPLYVLPAGSGGMSGTGATQEGSMGSQLGGGLVKGAMQELGIPDVFGTSPMQWGSVKMAMTGLGDAMGFLHKAAGDGGGARLPAQPGPGILGSLGAMLPGAGQPFDPSRLPGLMQPTPQRPAEQPPQPGGNTITGAVFHINQEGVMSPKEAGNTIHHAVMASTAYAPSAVHASLK